MIGLASLLAALALGVGDSLMVAGISHDLALYRAAHIRAVRYDLDLDVTRRDTVVGSVRVSFTRVNGGDVILDFRGYSLSSVKVNGVAAKVATDGAGTNAVSYNGAHLRIPAARLADGVNVVALDFLSPIAPSGASVIRFTDDTDKRDYLYTLLVPSDANLLFPCFDQPDLKAVFAVDIAVPSGWSALSNGPGSVVGDVGSPSNLTPRPPDHSVRYRFTPTKPISTYLFAFAAGPYTQLRDAKGDITLWVRASRAREVERDTLIALNRAAKTWLAQYFGVPYPFEKLDFLLAPAFPFGGMEHPGAIFYNEESFIYREPPTLNQRLGRQATVNHEIAHQWFGDYATMKWFDDLWLKEGFATYMAAKMQAATGDSTAWMSFYLRNKPAAYDVDASAGTTSVWQELANLDQAKSNYGAIVYNKAPGVLKQLNHLVGETAFRKGVHDFLVTHAYGNGTWQELLASVGKAAGRDLGSWGQSYFVRPGMPIVEQQLTIGDNGRIRRLALIQHPAQPLSGKGVWPMKVDVRAQYGGAQPVMLPVELAAETTVVAGAVGLPRPNFVYPNAGDYGYGLFMLDTLSTEWLLRNAVPVPDRFLRAMIWGSLWDLVRDARLMPVLYAQQAVNMLAIERDEQIASRLMGRVVRVVDSYMPDMGADHEGNTPRLEASRQIEEHFLAGARDSARSYGLRKNFFDSFVSVSRSRFALARLNAWLDSTSAAGMPLRQPTRWSIVTALIARGFPSAEARLTTETRRDTTTGGKRRAFMAAAAFPRAETKRAYFDRYFADSTLNEEWVTASLGAFNAADQDALTLPFLRPALDTLPWIQKNRRIFFLGAWLNAFIGGQRTPQALAIVDQYLAEHPDLPRDLRQKVLQARDDLERTVRIRARFGG
ncbi:MAG TPA: M1 family aminopeptidase [Gemmatimonadaceae bacterium]|nr:M1 family aminopeptidase [Gemmatimonadaceae bacterium]